MLLGWRSPAVRAGRFRQVFETTTDTCAPFARIVPGFGFCEITRPGFFFDFFRVTRPSLQWAVFSAFFAFSQRECSLGYSTTMVRR